MSSLCPKQKIYNGNVSRYARAAGVGISIIQNYLSGRSIPNSETIEKHAKAAGISKDDLYHVESSVTISPSPTKADYSQCIVNF